MKFFEVSENIVKILVKLFFQYLDQVRMFGFFIDTFVYCGEYVFDFFISVCY